MNREELIRQEIERYRKKIDTYQAMIAEWESELRGLGGQPPMAGQPDGSIAKKGMVNTGDPLAVVQGLVFFNMSQPEAAKALLEMVTYPLTTTQILEGIEKGGVKVGGKTAVAKRQNLYTILHRSTEFGLAKKDTWGLVGWQGITKKTEDETEKKNGKEDAVTGGEVDAAAVSKT